MHDKNKRKENNTETKDAKKENEQETRSNVNKTLDNMEYVTVMAKEAVRDAISTRCASLAQEITEEQARELLIDSSGKINFPDYEVDLSVGAAKVREFIANGGFIDGDDYLELAQKYSVLSAKTEKYFGKFYDKIKKVFDEDIRKLDLGNLRG